VLYPLSYGRMMVLNLSVALIYLPRCVLRGAEAGAPSSVFAPRLHHVLPISARIVA
jgi:hypothetical protein